MKVRDNAFKYYFKFMQSRMDIWWKRYEGKKPPYTKDPILQDYRFTQVYRSLDRVSQYLIKDVIYVPGYKKMSEEDIILRILLFKIFNKIETWQDIEKGLGEVNVKTFDVKKVNDILAKRIVEHPVFTNAFMSTGMMYSRFKGGEDKFKHKHERYIQVLADEMMNPLFLKKIIKAKKLEDIYKSFLDITYVAGFIAMQHTIDLNYSPIINFDENSFIHAGKGTVRGIHKAAELGNWSEEKFIHWVHENLQGYAKYYGYDKFRPLPGRMPMLCDLSNVFCEFDKYTRMADPSLQVYDKGKKRKIKNTFKMNPSQIEYFFPPKWGDVMLSKNK